MYKNVSAPPAQCRERRPAPRSAELQKAVINEPFGRDGYIRYMPSAYSITIRAHGAPADTAHHSASGLKKVICGFMKRNGIERTAVKNIYLQSCYGRDGWIFSQSAALANVTGLKVFSVHGKYREQRDSDMKVTGPNRSSFVRSLSKQGNKALYRVIEPGVSVISMFRRISSGRAASAQADAGRSIARDSHSR